MTPGSTTESVGGAAPEGNASCSPTGPIFCSWESGFDCGVSELWLIPCMESATKTNRAAEVIPLLTLRQIILVSSMTWTRPLLFCFSPSLDGPSCAASQSLEPHSHCGEHP